jgi:hypothetical protein
MVSWTFVIWFIQHSLLTLHHSTVQTEACIWPGYLYTWMSVFSVDVVSVSFAVTFSLTVHASRLQLTFLVSFHQWFVGSACFCQAEFGNVSLTIVQWYLYNFFDELVLIYLAIANFNIGAIKVQRFWIPCMQKTDGVRVQCPRAVWNFILVNSYSRIKYCVLFSILLILFVAVTEKALCVKLFLYMFWHTVMTGVFECFVL